MRDREGCLPRLLGPPQGEANGEEHVVPAGLTQLPHVDTGSRTPTGARGKRRSLPPLAFLSVMMAARILNISPQGLKAHLRKRPELFSPPMYRRVGSHPRLHRALTMADLYVLAGLMLKLGPWRQGKRGGEKR